MAKLKIGESLKLGLWVTATILIVNYLAKLVGIQITELFAVTGATGITPTIARSIVDFINGLGVVTIDPLAILYLWLSSVIIIIVGTFVYGMIGIPKAEGWTRLAAILLWGTLVFYFVYVGFVMQAWQTIVGVVVYYGVVALSLGLFQKTVRRFVKI